VTESSTGRPHRACHFEGHAKCFAPTATRSMRACLAAFHPLVTEVVDAILARVVVSRGFGDRRTTGLRSLAAKPEAGGHRVKFESFKTPFQIAGIRLPVWHVPCFRPRNASTVLTSLSRPVLAVHLGLIDDLSFQLRRSAGSPVFCDTGTASTCRALPSSLHCGTNSATCLSDNDCVLSTVLGQASTGPRSPIQKIQALPNPACDV